MLDAFISPGTVISGRFRLDQLAGRGGMASVYRAHDLERATPVAVKLLRNPADHELAERFQHEAQALCEVEHPNVVGYVEHGVADARWPYLAMDWLDGCDLAIRLREAPLAESQAITMALQVCDALSAIHARGIIHRDLKPANLFLVDTDIEQLKLIDFGLARLRWRRTHLTAPGVIMGTPSFLAPEQAVNMGAVDTRADLYSLGALLFTSLTGRTPVDGRHTVAVLAKLLFEPIPRVRVYRADISRGLDRLIARLLAKEPDQRPSCAEEVADELTRIARIPAGADRRDRHGSEPLSHLERQFFSILMIERGAWSDDDPVRDQLTSLASQYDAEVQRLADGTLVAVFSTDEEPVHMAASAARSALAVHRRYPAAPIVVATGLGARDERALIGEVIDRAVALMLSHHGSGNAGARATSSRPGIIVDDATSGLIDKAFQMQAATGHSRALVGEKPRPDPARMVLGKQASCIGRERTLAALEAMFNECVADSTSRAMLITGSAGLGKSRVARELTDRLAARDQPISIWSAHADSMHAGSAFGLAGQIIHRAMSMTGGDPPARRRQRIRDHVATRVQHRDVDRVSAFLGEIAGVPFSGHGLMQLTEARRDPLLLHDHMRHAWEDWLAAEAQRAPILCVLDDLHWSDEPTVRFFGAALARLRDQPFMVLALARPEVDQRFPDLWSQRRPEHMPLGSLSRRACAQLARQILGRDPSDEEVQRLVQRSDGNPFYLEELLRTFARGHTDELPDTILAMVSARLRSVPSEERRVLRAASVFGKSFWVGGVAALLNDADGPVTALLDRLCERDLVERRRDTRFAGHAEYAFRHQLIREAAYAALPRHEQTAAHCGAGQWLERIGEPDPVILSEHYWLGKSPDRALPWLHRAAEKALDASDIDAVLDRVERAVACGAEGETLGVLRLLQAEAHNWRTDHVLAVTTSLEAIARIHPGSDRWAHAVHQAAWALGATGDIDELARIAIQLWRHIPAHPSDVYLASMAICIMPLAFSNRRDEAMLLQALLEQHTRERTPGTALAAIIARMHGVLATVEARWDRTAEAMTRAVALWNELGNQRDACNDECNLGSALYQLGQYEQSAEVLQACLARSQRAGLTHLLVTFGGMLALALARTGDTDHARRVLERLDAHTDRFAEARNLIYRAQFALLDDCPREADAHIDRAVELIEPDALPNLHAYALAVRAEVMLATGRAREALDAARAGMAILESVGVLDEGDALLRLVHARALHDTGRHADARRAIETARDHVLDQAARIDDAEWRASFLLRVPEHRRIMERAAAWLGDRAS